MIIFQICAFLALALSSVVGVDGIKAIEQYPGNHLSDQNFKGFVLFMLGLIGASLSSILFLLTLSVKI